MKTWNIYRRDRRTGKRTVEQITADKRTITRTVNAYATGGDEAYAVLASVDSGNHPLTGE